MGHRTVTGGVTSIHMKEIRRRAAEIGSKLLSGQITSREGIDEAVIGAATEINLNAKLVREALKEHTKTFSSEARLKLPDVVCKDLGITKPKVKKGAQGKLVLRR